VELATGAWSGERLTPGADIVVESRSIVLLRRA
jgi:hypothetical protein